MITHLPVTVAGPWCDTRLAAFFLIIADVLDVRFEHLFNYDSSYSTGYADVGVIRVSGAFLRKNTKRNALLRITLVDEDGRRKKSIVRIVRAATGRPALRENEIALQYDDRIELGIRKAGTTHTLEFKPVHDWLGLPIFLLGHPSPLVRREVAFAIALMIVGVVIGFVAGSMIS